MNKKPIIAIDGPAASGKGTLSRALSETLGYAHMDTGALYRAVAFELLGENGNPEVETDARRAAETLTRRLTGQDDTDKDTGQADRILGNPALREDHIGETASKIAAYQAVRDMLIDLQRNFAQDPGASFAGAVLDGRDIGTVICPAADVKLFITADVAVRAARRRKELHSRGVEVTYDAVLKDMRARDDRDRARKAAPMTAADDAVIIDTGDLDAQQVLDKALRIVRGVLS